MSNAVLITARGNNESIPDKNILSIAGKPALGYVIESALKANKIDKTYLSTDCQRIEEMGRGYGCAIIRRPPELALPDANHGDVIAHGVETIKKEIPDLKIVTVLLGNTVMVTPGLIDLSVEILEKRDGIDSVMSVWQAQDDHPYRAMSLDERGFLKSFLDIECGTSRQQYPKTYFYDQGVWTLREKCVRERKGPNPWWWMGEKSFPIVRRWVTGRDFHSELDLRFSEFWVRQGMEDLIENIEAIERARKG